MAAAAAAPPVSSQCAASRSLSSSSAVRAAVASNAVAAQAVVVGGVRERQHGFEGVAGVVPMRAGVAAAAAVRHRRGEEADATTITRVAPDDSSVRFYRRPRFCPFNYTYYVNLP